MTRDEVRAMLIGYTSLKSEYDELDAMLYSVRSPSLSSQGGGHSDKGHSYLKIMHKKEALGVSMKTVEDMIGALPEEYREVLYCRYILGWRRKRVMRELDIHAYSTLASKESRAIDKIASRTAY